MMYGSVSTRRKSIGANVGVSFFSFAVDVLYCAVTETTQECMSGSPCVIESRAPQDRPA